MYAAPRDPDERFAPVVGRWRLFLALQRGMNTQAAAVVATNVTMTGIQVVFFWLVGLFIDRTFAAGRVPNMTESVLAVGLGVAVIALHWASTLGNSIAMTRVMAWIRARTMHRVIRHSVDVGAPLLRTRQSGDVVSTAITDADYAAETAFFTYHFGLQTLVRLVLTAAVGVFVSWRVGLALFAGAVVVVVLSSLAGRLVAGPTFRKRKAQAAMTALATDGLAGLRILRGLGATGAFVDRYSAQSADVRRRDSEYSAWRGVSFGINAALSWMLLVVITAYSLYEVDAGRLSVGGLATLNALSLGVVVAASQATLVVSGLIQCFVGLGRIESLLNEPTGQDIAGAPTRSDVVPTGELRDGLSGLRVTPGAFTVVTGDPLAVATALNRLGRLDQVDAPTSVDGVPLSSWSLQAVRGTIVVSDPRPQLLSGTLRSQVDPTGVCSDAQILAALHTAGADDVVELLPFGLDDYVTEKGRSLSGGQRQRVALARVIAGRTPIALLIEPTSAVDAPTEHLIAHRLREARAGLTTVVASNSPLFAAVADHVVALADTRQPSEVAR